MKRNNYIQQLIAAGVLLLCITACGKGETLPDGDEEAVGFQPSVAEVITKAEHLWSIDGAGNTDWLKEVGVYAYQSGSATPFFNVGGGLKVNRSGVGDRWLYTPLTLWPGDDITFYGYAPTGDGGRSNGPTDGKRQRTIQNTTVPPTIDFMVDGYPEFQVDLLLSVPQTQLTGVVVMPFRHALTKIIFSARVDDRLAALTDSVKIDTIALKKIVTHGSHSMDATKDWTYPGDLRLRDFYLERAPAVSTHTAELKDTVLTTAYNVLSTKPGVLLMLPQKIDDTKTLYLSYTVYYKGGFKTHHAWSYPLFPVSPDWRQGEQINYRILIKPEGVVLSVYGLPGSPE